MFPFYIRYVIVPDGLKAEAKGTFISAQVRHPAAVVHNCITCAG